MDMFSELTYSLLEVFSLEVYILIVLKLCMSSRKIFFLIETQVAVCIMLLTI